MDTGPLLRTRSIQLAWILMPPLIMLTLFILLEVNFHAVDRRLNAAATHANTIPVLENSLREAQEALAALQLVSSRADAERLNAVLHALAMDSGVKLNALSVVLDTSGSPPFCRTEIRAEGDLLALGTFFHRAQRAASVYQLEFVRLSSAGPGSPPMYFGEFNLNIYGVSP